MFSGLFTDLARTAGELLPLPSIEPKARPRATEPEVIEPDPAPPTSAAVSDQRLIELAEQCELGDLAEQIQELAVRGARLSCEAGGDSEALQASAEPPLVAIDLATLPRPTPLPTSGTLAISVERGALAAPGDKAGPVSAMVSLGPGGDGSRASGYPDGDGRFSVGERPIVASPELTLPRAWSSPVQALGLRGDRVDRWEELRRRLAFAQGVDLTDQPARPLSIHRLLGYPDERTGQMPVWCELLERGVDLRGEPVFMHPMAHQVQEDAVRWRLLLQASRDPRLGWRWGDGRERLYVWVLEEELADRSFERIRAFVQ
jgi:hypothetical protein